MSETPYEAVIKSSIDAIITANGEGTILTVNPAASRIFGYPAEELLGRNMSVLTPEASRPLGDGVGRTRDRPDQRKVVTLFQAGVGSRRGGEIFPLRAVISYACQDGTPLFVVVVHDASEEAAAARAQRDCELRLRAIIETIPDGLIVIDEHGVIRSFSPAAVRMFGYEEAEIVGRNVAILMPPARQRQPRCLYRPLRGERQAADRRHQSRRSGRAQERRDLPARDLHRPVHDEWAPLLHRVRPRPHRAPENREAG
jgi:two-component system sensor kinase FixL